MPTRTRRVRGRRRGIKSRRIAGVGSPKKPNTGLDTGMNDMLGAITEVAAAEKKKAENAMAKLKLQSRQDRPRGTRKSTRSAVLRGAIDKANETRKVLNKLEQAIITYDKASQGAPSAPQIKVVKGNKKSFKMDDLKASLNL